MDVAVCQSQAPIGHCEEIAFEALGRLTLWGCQISAADLDNAQRRDINIGWIVGTAALATFIGGGALGETINSGLKLQRNTALFVGAALVGLLALLIDWLAALAQYFLKPKGI